MRAEIRLVVGGVEYADYVDCEDGLFAETPTQEDVALAAMDSLFYSLKQVAHNQFVRYLKKHKDDDSMDWTETEEYKRYANAAK